MIDILFDQYQRYNNVTNIINSMRNKEQTFRILEVGANEHQNLEKFLPNDQITYLDIQLPDYLQGNPKYILGDATAMDFPDNQYDIVVALDVFEHISEIDRENFISEIYRVSSEFFVITAPFHSIQVVEAERRVNGVYKSIFNKDFIWLEEHMINGLPDLNKLSTFLDARNIDYKIISHGNLEIWERMMTIHFVAAQNSRLGIYRNEIDRFYNQYMFEHDFVETSYRKICVASKKRELALLFTNDINKLLQEKYTQRLKVLEERFYVLANLNIPEHINTPRDFVQIFIDRGEGYSESNSKKVDCLNNRQKIEMKFESDMIYSIRIDPSNYKGTFEINNLRITSEDNINLEAEDYTLSGNWDLTFGEKFVFNNDDPFVIYDFSFGVSIKELSFDIFALTQEEAITSVIDHFSNELDAVKDQLNNELIEIGETVTEKEQIIENIIFEVKGKSDQILAVTSELEKANNMIDSYKHSNDFLQKNIEELQMEVQKLQQSNEIHRKELNNIYTSRGWKYLTKFKNIFGK